LYVLGVFLVWMRFAEQARIFPTWGKSQDWNPCKSWLQKERQDGTQFTTNHLGQPLHQLQEEGDHTTVHSIGNHKTMLPRDLFTQQSTQCSSSSPNTMPRVRNHHLMRESQHSDWLSGCKLHHPSPWTSFSLVTQGTTLDSHPPNLFVTLHCVNERVSLILGFCVVVKVAIIQKTI
jgi:hypothetical protein